MGSMSIIYMGSTLRRSARALVRMEGLSLPVLRTKKNSSRKTGTETRLPERSLPLLAPGPKRSTVITRGIKKVMKLAIKALVYFHIWFVGVTSISVAVFAFIQPAATTLSLSRKYIDGWKILKPLPVRLEAVPLTARRMLVTVEDYKFWTHNGIDLEAFSRAVEINKRIGRPMYGGSTLTMQTARTLFLVPVKSYMRKYLEVIVAFELELLLPKRRILELYFSWAEWGKGVFGIEAASRLYYGVSVSKLDGARLAKLISILSSPIRYSPSTFARSGLLRSRYEFLEERYLR
jgi:monofunctional biosynthetic peptidoglycan transglycosylase